VSVEVEVEVDVVVGDEVVLDTLKLIEDCFSLVIGVDVEEVVLVDVLVLVDVDVVEVVLMDEQ
jgi:hypothetical protein